MIKNALYTLILLAVAFTGYVAVRQTWQHKREVLIKKTEILAPAPANITPADTEPSQSLPRVETKEVPGPQEPYGPENSNHFSVQETADHTYRVGFVGDMLPMKFPDEDFNREILGALLENLKKQNVQIVFLADSITIPNGSNDQIFEQIEKRLVDLYNFSSEKLGADIKIFPVFDCTLTFAQKVMPIINKTFKIDPKNPTGPYDVSAEDSTFIAVQTDRFDPKTNLINTLKTTFKELQNKPRFIFVVGYDAPFPITSYIANDVARMEFWRLLIDEKVTAYFSFREQVFNRVLHKGIWQIISGGGGAALKEDGESPPFYHAVILRIPSQKDAKPSVQAIDVTGNVVDEFELSDVNNPLHQLHISG